jgi:hypothetical protein
MSEETQVKQKTTVAVDTKELSAFLTPKTGSLLVDSTVVKLFPGMKDIPAENEQKAKEVLARPLKITNTSEDVNTAYAYLKRLEVLKEMLSKTEDFNALRKKTKEKKDKVAEIFKENMQNVFTQQRNLEKTYREIDNFFYESRLNPGENVSYIEFVNAHPDKHFDKLMDPDEGLASRFPNRENFDMRSLVGLIVMPDWPGSEAKLVKYGEVAQHFAAHLFAGFPDMELKEAIEGFDVGGDFADLKSADRVKQHISVVANPLRMRRANAYEKNLGDFYVNPTSILAGKIYKGDIKEGIHIAQANKPHEVKLPTPDGSPIDMKWNVRGAQQMKFNKALIPLSYYEGLVFWGVDTLYLASGQGDEGMDQYTVKRCDEYISKVVLHFLNGQTFVPNEVSSRDRIHAAISKFLMNNTGGPSKMLEIGKVDAVETVRNPDGSLNNQAIDIKVSVKYKNAVRQLNLYLVSDDQGGWKEGK